MKMIIIPLLAHGAILLKWEVSLGGVKFWGGLISGRGRGGGG